MVLTTLEPAITWMRRIPAFDVKVTFGSLYVFPVSTHLALTGGVLMCGLVHAGAYFVPQREPDTCGLAAVATPVAPAATAHATTTVVMALRNFTTPQKFSRRFLHPARSRTRGTLPSSAAEMQPINRR